MKSKPHCDSQSLLAVSENTTYITAKSRQASAPMALKKKKQIWPLSLSQNYEAQHPSQSIHRTSRRIWHASQRNLCQPNLPTLHNAHHTPREKVRKFDLGKGQQYRYSIDRPSNTSTLRNVTQTWKDQTLKGIFTRLAMPRQALNSAPHPIAQCFP